MTTYEHKINLKYQIGDKIKSDSHIYTIVGFDYIQGRGIRYILLYINNNKIY